MAQVTGATQGAKKSPGDVYIRKQHLKELKAMMKHGVTVVREKKHKHGKGRKKTISSKTHFCVPQTGYIFQSWKGAKSGHLHYHAIYDQARG